MYVVYFFGIRKGGNANVCTHLIKFAKEETQKNELKTDDIDWWGWGQWTACLTGDRDGSKGSQNMP